MFGNSSVMQGVVSVRCDDGGDDGENVMAGFARLRLQFLCLADFSQHTGDKSKQLVERVKSRCLARWNVFHPARESPGLHIGFRLKLNDESRFVLPSNHHERIIARVCLASHKPAVKFL
jgi:hypothetical protein